MVIMMHIKVCHNGFRYTGVIRALPMNVPPMNVGGTLLFSACPSVCLSVSLSVVTLTQSLLIGFLQISYRDCFHQPLVQVCIRVLSTSDNQDGRQNGRHLLISAVVVTQTQSFLIRFLPNFIYELLPSTFRSRLEYGFCPTSDYQDGRQNGRRLSMSAVVVTLT